LHYKGWIWLINIDAAATIDYLDSGKVKTKGIVNKTFKLEQYGEALESIKNKSAIKAAIVFD
jgi:D-arabinitol dehydrogenase (NADP+)